jgi:hypothetical protein
MQTFFNPVVMMRNHKHVEFVHTIMAIFAGAVAGILGVTGLQGFLLFITAHAVVSGAPRCSRATLPVQALPRLTPRPRG